MYNLFKGNEILHNTAKDMYKRYIQVCAEAPNVFGVCIARTVIYLIRKYFYEVPRNDSWYKKQYMTITI
jgi:hypothetical protein